MVGKNINIPDELYAKYISIIAGLPNGASIWSIILCSLSVSSLNTNLKDKMEETFLIMPPLNNMASNTLQIQGLMILRTVTVTSFRAMKEEEKRIRRLIP